MRPVCEAVESPHLNTKGTPHAIDGVRSKLLKMRGIESNRRPEAARNVAK